MGTLGTVLLIGKIAAIEYVIVIYSNLFNCTGASHKIVALDRKRWTDSEIAAQEFYTKRLSVTGVDDETLEQIHKFTNFHFLFKKQLLMNCLLCKSDWRKENLHLN